MNNLIAPQFETCIKNIKKERKTMNTLKIQAIQTMLLDLTAEIADLDTKLAAKMMSLLKLLNEELNIKEEKV